jgi:hypothetical protein
MSERPRRRQTTARERAERPALDVVIADQSLRTTLALNLPVLDLGPKRAVAAARAWAVAEAEERVARNPIISNSEHAHNLPPRCAKPREHFGTMFGGGNCPSSISDLCASSTSSPRRR